MEARSCDRTISKRNMGCHPNLTHEHEQSVIGQIDDMKLLAMMERPSIKIEVYVNVSSRGLVSLRSKDLSERISDLNL